MVEEFLPDRKLHELKELTGMKLNQLIDYRNVVQANLNRIPKEDIQAREDLKVRVEEFFKGVRTSKTLPSLSDFGRQLSAKKKL